MLKNVLVICLVGLAILFYVDKLHPKFFHENLGVIDEIIVQKEKRLLSLYKNGENIKSYPISLGGNPTGHKIKEGDGRTPEGVYWIDWVHPNSSYHKAIRISYPNLADEINAKNQGSEPGGDIMIHGLPNGLGLFYPFFIKNDWTEGCIAVSNRAIEEIESSVKIGTKVVIKP
jgi:murein L,D-transpeptidase YafK